MTPLDIAWNDNPQMSKYRADVESVRRETEASKMVVLPRRPIALTVRQAIARILKEDGALLKRLAKD